MATGDKNPAAKNQSGINQSGINDDQYGIVNKALLDAVEERNFERITLCLQKGADINTRNREGRTPVMIAVWKESPTLLEFLLRSGPDLFLKDNGGKTAYDLLESARDANYKTRMTDMLLKALPNAQPKEGNHVPAADAAREEFNDVSTREAVRISRPITLTPKDGKKPAGNDGGFKL